MIGLPKNYDTLESFVEEIVKVYERMMKWLRRCYPAYRKNSNIRLGRPKGDPFSIRGIVWLFYRLERLGWMPGAFLFLAKKSQKHRLQNR